MSPTEVDQVLSAHSDIAEAATFPVAHSSLGEIPVAAVVPMYGARPNEEEVLRFLRARLAHYKVPARIVIVERIPKSAVGKVRRRQLPRLLRIESARDLPPRQGSLRDRHPTPAEARLQRLWKKALRIEQVGLDDNFFLLGGDSLLALELFLQIEREFGCHVPLSLLYEATTLAEMADRIERGYKAKIIVPIRSGGRRPPFFSVHTMGGEILDQMGLARHLGDDQPFYALQAIGLDESDPLVIRMEDRAARYIDAMKSVQPDGPYFLGGPYSGGVVAFEIARQLTAAGDEVALLALFESDLDGGPGGPPLPPLRFWNRAFRRWTLKHWSRVTTFKLSHLPGYVAHRFYRLYTVHGLPFRSRIFGWLVRYYGWRGRSVPPRLTRPLELGMITRRNYVPQPYDGSAILFRAAVSYRNAARQEARWRALLRGGLEVRILPGMHDEIVREPVVGMLANDLAACIARCCGNRDSGSRWQEPPPVPPNGLVQAIESSG